MYRQMSAQSASLRTTTRAPRRRCTVLLSMSFGDLPPVRKCVARLFQRPLLPSLSASLPLCSRSSTTRLLLLLLPLPSAEFLFLERKKQGEKIKRGMEAAFVFPLIDSDFSAQCFRNACSPLGSCWSCDSFIRLFFFSPASSKLRFFLKDRVC